MAAIKKAVIYTRVSSGGQEENTSLAGQYAACVKKAQELGATVVAHYEETKSGGLYLARPGIQSALSDLESGTANTLLIYKLDRTGRDVGDLRDIRKRVRLARGELIFADGLQFDASAVGDLMFTQISAFAEFERATIRERTVRGIRARANEGKQPGRGFAPFGYTVVRKLDVLRGEQPAGREGTYLVRSGEAETVPVAYEKYRELKSLALTASWLNRNGYATRKGGLWRPGVLMQILTNTVYKGEGRYSAREWIVDEARASNGRHIRYPKWRDESEWIKIPAPPLVTPELWAEVNAIIATGRKGRSGPISRYLLTGLGFCPLCGRRMHSVNQNSAGAYKLRCAGAVRATREHIATCSRQGFSGLSIETLVLSGIESFLTDDTMLAPTVKAYNEAQRTTDHLQRSKNAGTELARLEKTIAKLKARELAAASAALDAAVAGRSADSYESLRATAEAQRGALEAQCETIRARVQLTEVEVPALPAVDEILPVLRDLTAPLADRRTILGTVVKAIYPIPAPPSAPANRAAYTLDGVRFVVQTGTAQLFVVTSRFTGKAFNNRSTNIKSTLEVLDSSPFPVV